MAVTAKHNYQDYDSRQRLTGAVVLILLAIILLPMLLSKNPESQEPEQTEPVVMEVTKEGKNVFVSRISSTTATESGEPLHQAANAEKKEANKSLNSEPSSALFRPMQRPAAKPGVPVKSATKVPVKKAAAKKPVKKQAVVKKSQPAVVVGWVVQVGVFSQPANARKKVSELKKKGFSASSGKVKTSKGTATKVWIGPFKDRKSAEKMQERLQHKTRQRGIVVKK